MCNTALEAKMGWVGMNATKGRVWRMKGNRTKQNQQIDRNEKWMKTNAQIDAREGSCQPLVDTLRPSSHSPAAFMGCQRTKVIGESICPSSEAQQIGRAGGRERGC